MFHQVEKSALQFGNAHVFRAEVDVEERAEFPRLVADDAAFLFEPRVKRRADDGVSGCRNVSWFGPGWFDFGMDKITGRLHGRFVLPESANAVWVDDLKGMGFTSVDADD